MTTPTGKSPKKERPQTPAERQEALRYNQMMYGPTAGERRPSAKRLIYGTPYLQHPKFQSLMASFKKGTAFQFEVTDKGRTLAIATDGAHITFDGRVLFYSRPSNRFEEHLLLDRSVALHYQTLEAMAHLVFAVLRSLPELDGPQLSYLNKQFLLGAEALDAGLAEQGPNLMLGSFRHAKVQGRKQG